MDFDGEFESFYAIKAEDMGEEEIEIVRKSNDFKSRELESFISNI